MSECRHFPCHRDSPLCAAFCTSCWRHLPRDLKKAEARFRGSEKPVDRRMLDMVVREGTAALVERDTEAER